MSIAPNPLLPFVRIIPPDAGGVEPLLFLFYGFLGGLVAVSVIAFLVFVTVQILERFNRD